MNKRVIILTAILILALFFISGCESLKKPIGAQVEQEEPVTDAPKYSSCSVFCDDGSDCSIVCTGSQAYCTCNSAVTPNAECLCKNVR